ncbi:unnamed protein product [Clavelina lepadiformis]|uniref:Sushi domain-containing protein n=1 Tax=Clavelina lepadiformis TaxID=159417 RepID=A0ABP0F8Q3_CLALP
MVRLWLLSPIAVLKVRRLLSFCYKVQSNTESNTHNFVGLRLRCAVCENQPTNEDCFANGAVVECYGEPIQSVPPCENLSMGRNRVARAMMCLKTAQPTKAKFSHLPPICRQNPQCNEMQAPEFGTKVCTQDGPLVDVGTKCNFECNKRFKLIGSMESQCVKDVGPLKAYFDNDPPVCKRE